jgi:hypothetical protein
MQSRLCPREYRVWLEYIRVVFLTAMLSASTFLCAADATEDYRLFFPLNPSLKASGVSPDATQEPPLSELVKTESSKERSTIEASNVKLNSKTKKSTGSGVFFSGVIRSENRTLLLVNDLPCLAIYRDGRNGNLETKEVVCAHVNQKLFSFKLQLYKKALLVFKNQKYSATLFVGQGI